MINEEDMKNYLNNVEVDIPIPMVFVKQNGKTNLVVSHVASTILTIVCLTYLPWLAPAFMEACQTSK